MIEPLFIVYVIIIAQFSIYLMIYLKEIIKKQIKRIKNVSASMASLSFLHL